MYLWLSAILSSVAVSLASLICLALLPWLGRQQSRSTTVLPEATIHALMAFAAGEISHNQQVPKSSLHIAINTGQQLHCGCPAQIARSQMETFERSMIDNVCA